MELFKKETVLALILTLFLISCNDFFEIEPKKGINLDDADPQLLLNSVYANLIDPDVYNISRDNLRTDIASSGVSVINKKKVNGYNEFFIHDFNNSNVIDVIEGKWNAYYRAILQANATIVRVQDLPQNDVNLDILAQARFLRGLFYFYLHSSFEKDKIIIKTENDVSSSSFADFSSSTEVINFFREDLEYGMQNLKTVGELGTRNLVSSGFAAVTLGTSYLYEGEYDKAKKLFEEIVQGDYGTYSLYTGADKVDMFSKNGIGNIEKIFVLKYDDTDATSDDVDPDIKRNVFTSDSDPSGFNEKTDVPDKDKYGGGRPAPEVVPTHWLTLAYLKEESIVSRKVPLRASAMIATANDDVTKYYREFAVLGAKFDIKTFVSYFKKYTNHIDRVFEDRIIPSGKIVFSGRDLIVSRYADVLLMLAECHIESPTPNLERAIELIDEIRTRWELKSLADIGVTSLDQVRDHLRNVERPLELAFEGHSIRAMDLRRWDNGTYASNRYTQLATEKYFSRKLTNIRRPTGTDEEVADIISKAATGLKKSSDGTYQTKKEAIIVSEDDMMESDKVLANEFLQSRESRVTGNMFYYNIPLKEFRFNPEL